MKIQLENLRNKIEDFYNNIKERVSLRTVLLSVSVICLLILIIILISLMGKGKKTEVENVSEFAKNDDYFYLPSPPEVPDEYVYSREPMEKWDDAEADKWFVMPDEEMLNNISETNDKKVNSLLESMP